MAALASEPAGATAGQLVATDPLVVERTDTLEHAAQLMVEHQTMHAVFVDPVRSLPVGILSTLDVGLGRRHEQRVEAARAAGQNDDRARRLANKRASRRLLLVRGKGRRRFRTCSELRLGGVEP